MDDTKVKLAAIEAELEGMDAVHQQATRSANRRTNLMLGTGACILFTQFVAFIYLTW